MTQINEIYKCNICGNIVEVLHTGAGELVCCGQKMQLMKENTEDASEEKHIPEIEKTEKGFKIKIGSEEHPMIKEHYIEWIELITENKIFRKNLKPGEKPEAEFETKEKEIKAREYCNIHGLWKK
jgi:superoxide reductase